MTLLNPPFASGPFDVHENHVERYLALGFTRVEKSAPEPEQTPKPRRRRTKPKE